ncbi:MAG: phospholipid carrier-dependent glycosyltransferase [Patescibacteria group bacterium]
MKKLSKNVVLQRLSTNHLVLLLIIIIPGFLIRLHKINNPLADWHSWRQTDTASVSREFIKHDYSILEPHYQDLSNIPNGLSNIDGYRMVEFPIINYLIAQFIRSFPNLDLVLTSRLASIISSCFSILFLYGIVWKLSKNKLTSFFSAFVFAFLPYSVFYSRVILPEPFMITLQLLSLFSFIVWLEKQKENIKYQISNIIKHNFWILISLVSLSLALLLKPTTIFITPVFIILAFAYLGKKVFTTWQLYLFPLSLLPTFAWRIWIQNFPTGIPANRWLLNGNGIRLRPAWWRWLFADRLGRLILGYWGSIFVSLGLISKSKAISNIQYPISKFDLFTITYAASMFLYLVIFATGNVQHDYYQIILIPIVSILFARGITFLLNLPKQLNYKLITLSSVFIFILLSLYFSYYEVKGYFNINNPSIVTAGKRIDQLTPNNAKIIAPYMGDTAFLFQTNRTGWPIGGEIEKKINMGASYYVSTTYDNEVRELEKKYKVLEKTPEHIIIKL